MRTKSRTRAQSWYTRALFVMPAILMAQILLPLQAQAMGGGELLTYVNQERAKAGVTPLASNSRLVSAAHAKAADMFSKDYWSHNAPDGTEPWHFFTDNGYAYQNAGENLAKSFPDAASVITGWMNSPLHRKNLLSPEFREIGLVAEPGTLQGEQTVLVVAHFGSERSAKKTSAAAIPAVAAPTMESVGSKLTNVLPAQTEAVVKQTVRIFVDPRPITAQSLITETLGTNNIISTFSRAKLLLRL